MLLRKIACRFIKLLGGYTPLEYEAVKSLYKDYRRECFKYRNLVGPYEKAEEFIENLEIKEREE